jgi:hypothetical protein
MTTDDLKKDVIRWLLTIFFRAIVIQNGTFQSLHTVAA